MTTRELTAQEAGVLDFLISMLIQQEVTHVLGAEKQKNPGVEYLNPILLGVHVASKFEGFLEESRARVAQASNEDKYTTAQVDEFVEQQLVERIRQLTREGFEEFRLETIEKLQGFQVTGG